MDRSEIRAIKARKANDMRRKAEAAADNAIASRAEREGEDMPAAPAYMH